VRILVHMIIVLVLTMSPFFGYPIITICGAVIKLAFRSSNHFSFHLDQLAILF